jgi:hypothetical protein
MVGHLLKEEYKMPIVDLATNPEYIAVNVHTGELCECSKTQCAKCSYNMDGTYCEEQRKAWAESAGSKESYSKGGNK